MKTLIVENLEYGYGTPLFTPISFDCQAGGITAVLGSNGRGKTSLLHTLIDLLPRLSGNITHNGGIGFVPQIFTSHFSYSVLDIVLMGRASSIGLLQMPSKKDEQIALAALEKLGISNYAHRAYNTLSGGQRQLVLIARALSTQGKTLILDEPTAALDLKNQQSVLKLMKSLAKEDDMAILFTTHEPTHALLTADKTILMLPGDSRDKLSEQTWLYGENDMILTEENLKNAYGLPIREITVDGQRALLPLYTL